MWASIWTAWFWKRSSCRPLRAAGPAARVVRSGSLISILWIAFAILAAAVAFDLRSRQIPDTLSVLLLALAITATGFRLHRVSWLDVCLGLALGCGAGLLLFRLGGFGGGDVKLLASLGAVLGWKGGLGGL